MKTKLSASLQFAHAAELAAYHAYDGHRRSVSCRDERRHILQIQKDEELHILAIEEMLAQLNSEPNETKDRIGIFVGKCIGFACFVFGWRLPMMVAGFMEKIGTRSYREMADSFCIAGEYDLAVKLLNMAKNEEEHEEYFNNLRKSK